MLIVVLARRGSISFRPSLDHIPQQVKKHYMRTSVMLIFPDIYAETPTKELSINEPLTTDQRYETTSDWSKNWLPRNNSKEEES